MPALDLARPAAAIALACCLLALAPRVAEAQRTGTAPCRIGVLALMAMLDAGEQGKPEYLHAAKAVTETCGPPAARKSPAEAPAKFDQAACSKLALAMLDAIEENKIGRKAFTDARDSFARTCMPR